METRGYIVEVARTAAEGFADAEWIQAFPFGRWTHPLWGDVEMTPEIANTMKGNFDKNIRAHDTVINYAHMEDVSKGQKAAGWLRAMEVRSDGLYWNVDFTDTARGEIKAGEWRYFSPEWLEEWKSPVDQQTHHHVVVGGALTNVPFLKGILPINMSELGLSTTSEVAEKEHAEPGSGGGGEPTPRTDGDEISQSPNGPGQVEPGTPGAPKADTTNTPQEDNVVDLTELRAAFNLPADADVAAITAAATALTAEVAPLRAAAEKLDADARFATEFPQRHERMIALEESDRIRRASEFARQYERFGDEKDKGFSALVLEKIENAYKAADTRALKVDDVKDLLDAVASKEGTVLYGEIGSRKADDTGSIDDDPAMRFAAEVRAIQVEDKVDHATATRLATEKHPEMFMAYREHVKGGKR